MQDYLNYIVWITGYTLFYPSLAPIDGREKLASTIQCSTTLVAMECAVLYIGVRLWFSSWQYNAAELFLKWLLINYYRHSRCHTIRSCTRPALCVHTLCTIWDKMIVVPLHIQYGLPRFVKNTMMSIKRVVKPCTKTFTKQVKL